MSKTPRPVALPVQPEHIPEDLKALPQWVTWRYTWQQEKWDKPPRPAPTGRLASSTDPRTWSLFDDGVFCITPDKVYSTLQRCIACGRYWTASL